MRVIRTDASSGGTPSSSAPPPLFYGPDTGLLDRGYAGSCSAMLKVAQMLLLLIGFICVRSSQWTDYNAYSYFEIVCIYDLIMIFIFYIIYIVKAYQKLTCISWPLAVPMENRSLHHRTFLSPSDTSTAERPSGFGPVTSLFLVLLVLALCSSPAAYWTPSDLRDSFLGKLWKTGNDSDSWHLLKKEEGVNLFFKAPKGKRTNSGWKLIKERSSLELKRNLLTVRTIKQYIFEYFLESFLKKKLFKYIRSHAIFEGIEESGVSSLPNRYYSASYCIHCGSCKKFQFSKPSSWSGLRILSYIYVLPKYMALLQSLL